ncbi:hypothetical protein FNV43_RR03566 [Rhamnella rubrinervis]|uniref:Uncharacterized protein n=1 Tax=Rhamnella rubrinervis TaxID=2594499 RepID=A0A8K0HIM7_9ROSA|nr:hypothetical protein FNV43_RR03566 [Rhamnella rubrinervis]
MTSSATSSGHISATIPCQRALLACFTSQPIKTHGPPPSPNARLRPSGMHFHHESGHSSLKDSVQPSLGAMPALRRHADQGIHMLRPQQV